MKSKYGGVFKGISQPATRATHPRFREIEPTSAILLGVPQVPLFVQLLQKQIFKAVKKRKEKKRGSLLWSHWCHDCRRAQ